MRLWLIAVAVALLGCNEADPIKRGVDEKRETIDELRRAQAEREEQVRRRRAAAPDAGVPDDAR